MSKRDEEDQAGYEELDDNSPWFEEADDLSFDEGSEEGADDLPFPDADTEDEDEDDEDLDLIDLDDEFDDHEEQSENKRANPSSMPEKYLGKRFKK